VGWRACPTLAISVPVGPRNPKHPTLAQIRQELAKTGDWLDRRNAIIDHSGTAFNTGAIFDPTAGRSNNRRELGS
jgi:hypothetical protein